jgi:TonB family protein
MSLDLVWTNFTAYCMQIGLLIGVAALIPTILRLAVPRARLAFWHILLVTCLVLPLFAPWRQESITAGPSIPVVRTTPRPAAAPAVQRVIPWNQIALGLLAAGIVVRFAWLALGLARLRQYRRRAVPLDPPATWGVEADLRLSPDVASPVTFGAFRPVVLLPAHFRELDASTQEAILCHEILHVRRHDWLVTIAEEIVRSVFWFHPAIWWLLGEIGLAREQAVDREVIEVTRAREEYVDALLAIAGARPQLDLAPAPLFLRRRHLKHRVVSIMKEVRMSKTRSLSALATSLLFLAAACWLVTMTFPLSAQPQLVTDAPGVTVDLGNAAVMHRTGIMYPTGARGAKVGGTVLVEATLDSAGNVADAHIVSGPTELRRSVLQSVLQWHFANDTGANTRQIRITFNAPQQEPGRVGPATATAELTTTRIVNGIVTENRVGAPSTVMGGIIGSNPAARFGIAGKTLKQIQILGLTEDAKSRLGSRLPVRVGDLLSEDTFMRTIAAVREYDEHMTVGTRTDTDGAVTFTIAAPGANTSVGYAFSGDSQPPVPGRITVGGNVQQSKLVQQPRPSYPPLAKQARISGTVKLSVIIARDGTIQDMKVISGHPLLIPPTLEAVKNWVYQPTLLNGQPVEVMTQIDVNFTLADEIPQQQQ